MSHPAAPDNYHQARATLDSSSPPSWLRPLSLRFVDLSAEYFGAAARRLPNVGAPWARTFEWRQAWSDVIHSQRTLEALRDLGVTAVCVHCDDGLGRVAQADDLRHAQQFAQMCRDLELRVFARIEAGALYYETLLTDRPGLAAWAQRDPRGDIRSVQGGFPAWRPCYRSPGFLEFLKDCTSIACQQLEPDGIFLANIGPHDCHCERCQQAFRHLLRQRHPDWKETLGLTSLDHIRLPVEAVATDPLHPEAAYFRVQTIRAALAEIRIHLRSINARIALWAEPKLGHEALSCSAFAQVCAPLDIITCTHEGETAPCASVGGADWYLMGHSSRTFVHVRERALEQPSASPYRLATSLAAPMALGGHVVANHQPLRYGGASADPFLDALSPRFVSDEVMRTVWAQMLDFAARHEHYYYGAQPLAEVAFVFSSADIASSLDERLENRKTLRALLQAGIPIDVVPIEALNPQRHKLAVIAGQTRITDAEGASVCRCAEQGMALLLVGEAGLCDAQGRRRSLDAFGTVRTLPRVRSVAFSPAESSDRWRARVAETVISLLPDPPLLTLVGGPPFTTPIYVCAFRLPTGQAAFHLLNSTETPIEGLRLHVRADLAPSRHAAWHQPEATDVLLDCTLEGASVVTALPVLYSYGLVVIS